jgi:hypothetical protein
MAVQRSQHGRTSRVAVLELRSLLVVSVLSGACTYENSVDLPGNVNRFDAVAVAPAVLA